MTFPADQAPASTSGYEAPWGSAVVRFIPVRRVLNFWRLRRHDDEGLRVTYYATRRGIVVLSVRGVR